MRIITRADAIASGKRRYFTGTPCKHGHIAERTVCDHCCVECGRLNARDPKVRESRREYMAAHQRQYRKKHPDRVRATDEKRKDAQATNARVRRAKNPEPMRAALRRSFQKHKAKRMAETRSWKEANPEATSVHMRSAKAKRRAAIGSYTRQDVDLMLTPQRGLCVACSIDISESYHVDHIMPLARGGTNWPDNLQLLCGPCNRSKGKKTMDEWAAWKSDLKADPAPDRPQSAAAAH